MGEPSQGSQIPVPPFSPSTNQHAVRALTGVCFDKDLQWSLEVLKKGSQNLEEVEVLHFQKKHLAVLKRMHRLKRLAIRGGGRDQYPKHQPSNDRSDCWLEIQDIPRELMLLTLKTNWRCLKELRLFVPQSRITGKYPWIHSFARLVEPCNELERIVLLSDYGHNAKVCGEMRESVKNKNAQIEVVCQDLQRNPMHP